MKKEKIKEFSIYILIIVFVILIRTFVITPVKVNGTSMDPTLKNNEIMILNKIKYKKNSIKRFDIVVIKMNNELLIKRIIGLPGEKVKYLDNKLYINDEYIEEPFLSDDVYTTNFTLGDIKLDVIPENCYIVLGDNREVSLDSRVFGCFDKDKILGSANFVLFPFNKFGYKY